MMVGGWGIKYVAQHTPRYRAKSLSVSGGNALGMPDCASPTCQSSTKEDIMKLTKGQLEARKKRRYRNKPVKLYWRLWLRNFRKEYNYG